MLRLVWQFRQSGSFMALKPPFIKSHKRFTLIFPVFELALFASCSFSLLAQRKGTEKKRRPASRFFLRVAEPGGALSNSAPKQQGPQTAKGPFPARFCDARRGMMG
jgi:hypothetical protein